MRLIDNKFHGWGHYLLVDLALETWIRFSDNSDQFDTINYSTCANIGHKNNHKSSSRSSVHDSSFPRNNIDAQTPVTKRM
jgi:hypothetical protein